MKHTFFLILILLLCRLAVNGVFPLFDPSEARYADICANMARSGNYLEPQLIHDGERQIFQGKPPLYFQLGALSCRLFGVNEFAVRFPAFLSALAILVILFYTVKTLRNEKQASLTTLFCALTPVFLIFSGLCLTDLLLASAICGAVCFYILFAAEEKRCRKKVFSTLFFASLGIGMMVKGPVALLMAGMPIFLFVLINRRWRELKDHAWIGGMALFLLISLPWYAMMQSKNPDFLEYFFVNENFKRFLFKEYGDRYGTGRETFRGMALVYMLLCNLPFLLFAFAPLTGGRGSRVPGAFREYLRSPLTGIAFLWVVSHTLFWSLTSRVLITYLLPTIPAVAILAADLLEKSPRFTSETAEKRMRFALNVFCALSCAGLIGMAWFMPEHKNNAGHFFAQLAKLRQYEKHSFYFVKNTPYSAEFYLGERVFNHPKEDRRLALTRSGECILLATESDLKRISIDREIIARFGPWVVFAPETRNAGLK